MYHATKDPKTVSSAQEEADLGPEWSRVYIRQDYPRVKYHWNKKPITVKNSDEEAALGGGWASTPGAFEAYKGARPARTEEHNPVKWLNEWSVPGLSSEHRKKIKAQLLRADATFERSPDLDSAALTSMRQAFDGIARVLFDAGILTEDHLRTEVPRLVWDSAIAGGWWRLASETCQDIFPEQLGHYWVWRDDSRDWKRLFTAEAGEWEARLLETSSRESARDADEIEGESALPGRDGPERRSADEGTEIGVTSPPFGGETLAWEDIEVRFTSEHHVQIFVRGRPGDSLNFADMGFEDRRGGGGKPKRAWALLLALAVNDGIYPAAKISGCQSIQKRAQELRDHLADYFAIDGDPLPFLEGTGYQSRCKISRSPSFDT